MTNYSSEQKNVILEIAKVADETPAVLESIVGYEQKLTFDGCRDNCGNVVKNWNPSFDDFNGWQGMRICKVFNRSSDTPGGNSFPVGSIQYRKAPYDKYVFHMMKSDGSNPNFNGTEYSFLEPYGGQQSDQFAEVNNMIEDGRQNTEQGRLLYLYPRDSISEISQYKVALSFEIIEGDGHKLLVAGPDGYVSPDNGVGWLGAYIRDNAYPDVASSLAGYSTTESDSSYECEYDSFGDFSSPFWEHFDAYISPYVHSGKFKYDVSSSGGALEWNNNNQSLHCSYIRINGQPQFASMFSQGANGDNTPTQGMVFDTFGLRSTGELFDCSVSSQGNTTKGYNIKLSIGAINNAKIKILTFSEDILSVNNEEYNFALPLAGVDTSTYPWVWTEITQPGEYEVCVPYINETCEQEEEYIGSDAGWYDEMFDRGWSTHTVVQTGSMSTNDKITYAYQYRILRIEDNITGPGDPMVRINRVELMDGGQKLKPQSYPIYEYETTPQTLFDWDYLDVYNRDKVPLALNFNSGDLRDPSKKTTGYSKTFELPASAHNNRVLNTIIGNTSDKQSLDIGWNKARISVNGIVVFNGFARIEKGVTGSGGRYSCHILQDPSYWPELIADKKLCDLSFPTHTKNFTNIVNSWSSNVDIQPYVYPAISYGEWAGGANGVRGFSDFHPAVYAKAIVDRIFGDIGYTVNSDFFNSQFFKKLIIPYTSGEDYVETGGAFGANGDYFGEARLAPNDGSNMPDIDNTGLFGSCESEYYRPVLTVTEGLDYMSAGSPGSIQGGYTVPFTGRYTVYYRATVEISQCTSNVNSGMYAAWAHCNGQTIGTETLGGYGNACNYQYYEIDDNVGPPGFNIDGSEYEDEDAGNSGEQTCWWSKMVDGGDPTTKSFQFDADFTVGDKIQVGFYGKNNSDGCTAYCNIEDQVFQVYPTVDNVFVPPTEAGLSSALGCGVKQKEFLKGLTEMFNLYWTADSEAKTVDVEPYNDFYGSGNMVDWTKKIDTKSVTDKYIIQELAKETRFGYKIDNNDNLVEQYMNSMDRELWDMRHTNEDLYRKEYTEMGTTVFSPTFRLFTGGGGAARTFTYNYNDNPPTIPAMWGGGTNTSIWGYFNNANRPEREFDFNIRILNYHGLSPNTGSWRLTMDDGAESSNLYSYPYAYTYNEEHAADAEYDDNLAWHDKGSGDTFQRGLFNRYWGRLFDKISGGAMLRTCMMDLNSTDISRFDFRDIIKIDEEGGTCTYWTVNKIIDYQPGKDKLTKVELVQWDYEVPGTGGDQELLYEKGVTNYGILNNRGPYGDVEVKDKDGNIVRTMRIFKGGQSTLLPGNNIKENTKFKFSSDITPRVLNPEPRAFGEKLSKKANKAKKGGVAVGKYLRANKNQFVAGKYNKPTNSDLFQVGSGYVGYNGQIIKQNAISVDSDGNFKIYGGQVVAEFKTGDLTITGDVYYEHNGKKMKVFLKESSKNNINSGINQY
jgi:hypothetical protein